MGPLRSFGKAWEAAAAAVLIFILLQVGAGQSQEPSSLRIDDEFAKQEKIYRSQGAEVPDGYITYRALSDYAQLLPSDFCDALGRLGSADRWLDIGAGDGKAILDYYAAEGDAVPLEKCARSSGKARAVAISIEDRRTDNWRQRAASLGEDRIRYFAGKRLRHYSPEELGKFQIITDVFGGFSYTEDLSLFLEKVLGFLDLDGVFYTVVQNVHLEGANRTPNERFQTELVDTGGRDVKVCSWLKKTTCVKVVCESKSDWDSPSELINIRKVCSEVSVPRMKLLQFQAGNPPGRRFQLQR